MERRTYPVNSFLATLSCLTLLLPNADAASKPTFPLWTGPAPGAVGETDADRPTLTVWLPEKQASTRSAVVVCPGGGYRHLAMDHEGVQIAQWLNERGVAAFILEYRLAPAYKHPVMMHDVQRALRQVRSNASKYDIAVDKIGVWGFSAGGHLASTAATHFDDGNKSSDDPVDRVSCRPDFAILCYPVISMKDGVTHGGSKNNLLGDNPKPELLELMSNELQVTAKTPPTFLFHTTEDKAVPVENSLLFFLALRKAKVDCEMHVYQQGRHGVGLAQQDPILSTWPSHLADWLRVQRVVDGK
jgi:acetyl esterase/lipase